MTAAEREALGRRAVACKGWRWMPGMVTTTEARILGVDGPILLGWRLEGGDYGKRVLLGVSAVPDLSDPATLGCLLALVREAWAAPHVSVEITYNAWSVYTHGSNGMIDSYHGDPLALDPATGCAVESATEAEALVAALEAAPHNEHKEAR